MGREELLVRLHELAVEVVAARAEDILETLAVGRGIRDLVEITLQSQSQGQLFLPGGILR